MTQNVSPIARELVRGAIDIHVHSEPSFFKRSVNDLTLAEGLLESGMAAAVLKCHAGSTVCRAKNAETHVDAKVPIFGSIVLNYFVGGLNPYAVDAAIHLGVKIVYMPTISAHNHIRYYGGSTYKAQKSDFDMLDHGRGIEILDKHGRLKDSVIDIIDLVAKYDVCLATGHLSNKEAVLLCNEALNRGVNKILFTHADFMTNRLPLEQQVELASKGVFIEKTLLNLHPDWDNVAPKEMVDSIRAIGVDRCIMSTDYGQLDNPVPSTGMGIFIAEMIKNGVTEDEIKIMTRDNPKTILNM